MSLPTEILCLVIAYLSDEIRENFSRLSSVMRRWSTSEYMWRIKYTLDLNESPKFTYPSFKVQYRIDKILQPLRRFEEHNLSIVQKTIKMLKDHSRLVCATPMPIDVSKRNFLSLYLVSSHLPLNVSSGFGLHHLNEDIAIILNWKDDNETMYYSISVYERRRITPLSKHYIHDPGIAFAFDTHHAYLQSINDLDHYLHRALDEGFFPLDTRTSIVMPDDLLPYLYIRDK